jgi:hypothetical protein
MHGLTPFFVIMHGLTPFFLFLLAISADNL